MGADVVVDLKPCDHVRVWWWREAPPSLVRLHRGRRIPGWVALVPPGMDCPDWLQTDWFGRYQEEIETNAGTVWIGSAR